ncbi:putative choline oxidase [Cercophora scortea]|uniref:Choline oxidase n=1 Tax=Cercophora scortea TaxID=314031 RepID=A0AAE0J1I9_9PEZI|nr:putative choline oxidase [Cercophora scortea]
MTTTYIPASHVDYYDHVIVGGGTAGCVIAARLAEYLPTRRILLIEAGPSDFMDNRVQDLTKWLSLLGGDLDYDYGTTEQPMGNSHIRHSRAKVLGGCSSHNTLISFRPFEHDLKIWQSMGARGWDMRTMTRVLDKLRNTVQPVHARHRNRLCKDWVSACSTALSVPVIPDFNAEIASSGALTQAVGFFSVSYDPDTCHRSSASVAYLHPILRGDETRPNLTILTDSWVSKINMRNSTATGVTLTLKDGTTRTVSPRIETILCAGAIDTPRLLLLSGIGPASQLSALSIPVTHDLPGVGENLLDHPESIIMWELNRPVPPNQTTMDSDAGLFLRREPPNAANGDGAIADVMMHCYQIPFGLNTSRVGCDVPADGFAFCMTPNIPRPRSRGRLYLTSADPAVKPALDFRYLSDPEGYDVATLVWGIRMARKVAQESPFKEWIAREVAPGREVVSDEALEEFARRAHHTVFHPVGTCRMGDVNGGDDGVVVDERLRVRGIKGLRIADASVFPAMTTVNPMLTVLAVGERCAEMVVEDLGWEGERAKL